MKANRLPRKPAIFFQKSGLCSFGYDRFRSRNNKVGNLKHPWSLSFCTPMLSPFCEHGCGDLTIMRAHLSIPSHFLSSKVFLPQTLPCQQAAHFKSSTFSLDCRSVDLAGSTFTAIIMHKKYTRTKMAESNTHWFNVEQAQAHDTHQRNDTRIFRHQSF